MTVWGLGLLCEGGLFRGRCRVALDSVCAPACGGVSPAEWRRFVLYPLRCYSRLNAGQSLVLQQMIKLAGFECGADV